MQVDYYNLSFAAHQWYQSVNIERQDKDVIEVHVTRIVNLSVSLLFLFIHRLEHRQKSQYNSKIGDHVDVEDNDDDDDDGAINGRDEKEQKR